MALKIGELYAEIGVKDEGFDSGMDKARSVATQTGKEVADAVKTIESAGGGLTAAAQAVDAYATQLQAAEMNVSMLAGVLDKENQALYEMETAANAAAMKAGELEEQMLRLSQAYGEGSAQVAIVKGSYNEAAAEADELNTKVEAQEQKVAKAQIAFKKAEAAVQSYRSKLSSASAKVEKLAEKQAELNAQLEQTPTAAETTTTTIVTGMETATEATSKFGSAAEKLVGKTLNSSSRSLGTLTAKMLGFNSSSAAGIVVANGLQTAYQKLFSALTSAQSGYVALAVAAGYGLKKLADWGDTLLATTKAQEKLNITVETWEDDVKTAYETSKSLGAFGLDAADFKAVLPKPDGDEWLKGLTEVWDDGKKETNEIVKQWTDSFTSGTDDVRKSLTDLRETITSGGFADSLLGDVDGDLKRLDEIDKELETLLKKRQNGYFDDADLKKLQSFIDERGKIVVKYNLEPEVSDPFGEIITGVESALSRNANPAQVWADSYAAATEGLAAFNAALAQEYDAQYSVIQLLDDQVKGADGLTDRQRALNELQKWYNDQAEQGVKAYSDTVTEAMQLTDILSDGKYQETADGISTIVASLSTGQFGNVAEAMAGLDEAKFIEIATALTTMQAAAEQTGTALDEPAEKMLNDLESIKQLLKIDPDTLKKELGEPLFDSLNSMFGEGMDNEVLEVYAALNAQSLEDSYKAWAEGQHTDLLPTIELPEEPLEFDGDVTNLTIPDRDKLPRPGMDGDVKTVKIPTQDELPTVILNGKVYADGTEIVTDFKNSKDPSNYEALELDAHYEVVFDEDQAEIQTAIDDIYEKIRWAMEQTQYGNADLYTPEAAKAMADRYFDNLIESFGLSADDSNIEGARKAIYEWIESVYSGVDADVGDALPEDAWAALGDSLGDADVDDGAKALVTKVKEALESKKSLIRLAGYQFAVGYANGIKSGQHLAATAARLMAQEAIRAANRAQDSGSPSRVAAQIGAWFTEGYANGITSELRSAANAAHNVASAVVNSASANPGAAAQGLMSNAITGIAAANAQIIDYDRLAETLARHPSILVANGRRVATILGDDMAKAYNNRERATALTVRGI